MKISAKLARRIGKFGANTIRALGRTWRYRLSGCSRDELEPGVIYAFRHGDMVMGAHCFRDRGTAVMISQHRDGELIAQVCERLGFHGIRGSTTRGGSRAIREFIRGWADAPWAITPDGPRGPRGSIAPGLIQLAALSGRPVAPIGIVVTSAHRFSSWDRFAIPRPFAKIGVHIGKSMRIPRHLNEERFEVWTQRCRHALDEAYRDSAESIGLDRSCEDIPPDAELGAAIDRTTGESA